MPPFAISLIIHPHHHLYVYDYDHDDHDYDYDDHNHDDDAGDHYVADDQDDDLNDGDLAPHLLPLLLEEANSFPQARLSLLHLIPILVIILIIMILLMIIINHCDNYHNHGNCDEE